MNSNNHIITGRLSLRPVSITDSESILTYRSDAVENRYQGWIPKTIADVHDFIQNRVSGIINVSDTWFQFVIILNSTGELIGDIGIHFLDMDEFQVEIGCTLNKQFQGKGYANEALQEIINYLFSGLKKHRIIASIDPRNKPSMRMVERLGFRKEAHFKESLLINGEWLDDVVYAILKHEWLESKI